MSQHYGRPPVSGTQTSIPMADILGEKQSRGRYNQPAAPLRQGSNHNHLHPSTSYQNTSTTHQPGYNQTFDVNISRQQPLRSTSQQALKPNPMNLDHNRHVEHQHLKSSNMNLDSNRRS